MKCDNPCPPVCTTDQLICPSPDGFDDGDCPFAKICVSGGLSTLKHPNGTNKRCPSVCPTVCDNDNEFKCPGGTNAEGCPMPQTCEASPVEGSSSVEDCPVAGCPPS